MVCKLLVARVLDERMYHRTVMLFGKPLQHHVLKWDYVQLQK